MCPGSRPGAHGKLSGTLEGTVSEIQALGGKAAAVVCDLIDPAAREGLIERAIREAKREARLETGLAAKVEKHRKQKALEAQRAEKRRALFEAQDEVDGKKETLLVEIEGRLKQQVTEVPLFTIRWSVA